ncbi:LysM peptidoglycan-binding domain-containing M23 family metallopeptidase [Streptomyces sp. HNM0663]|uniref:LysM peptidoglycan-binding domain-containing M23 family metallopeptidase n=1 Tax=Streptomyces chengmaiensis TaxID=3040919 RepID=A0ABT6HJ56_9ACTN|nr:LysM peptidoglycan-binding domain-containing M23 family metallopeptidase [Streptomyces chengmaiensis]MDH2388089.1 LysM peptidoglycan-binding domain-containing M23 family metallopeptidase [Streptomyces chengmaiensis]
MPAKGKHRRPKSSPLARGFVAAGAGGAAIAIPLLSPAGAHAAETSAPAAAPRQAVTAAAAHAPAGDAKSGDAVKKQARKATPTTYEVVPGDYLSKIADEHDVRGGWQRLYADNREAVGDNPSLIHPGLKLTVHGKAAEQSAPAKAKAKAKAKPKAKTEAKAESKAQSAPKAPKKKAAPERSTSKASAAESTPAQKPQQPQAAQPAASVSGYSAPLSGASVTTPYRASGASWSSGYHTGVDFAAATGTTVKAVTAGTVVSAGWGGAYGNEVVIRHNDGTYSQYAHLSSLSVSSGQSVSAGQQIGLSGSTGNSTGPHLHFEVRTGPSYGSDIDPVAYLRQHGVSI